MPYLQPPARWRNVWVRRCSPSLSVSGPIRDTSRSTFDELRAVLEAVGINTAGQLRMSYIMMHAELDGVVCSGPRRGKQFTYALLEQRAPQTKMLGRDAALVELARRYFVSRGRP
jgi:hypothetical protein